MALFSGITEKRNAAEDEVLQKLSQVPILDAFINQIIEDGNSEERQWMFHPTGYYDHCMREVIFEADSIEIAYAGYVDQKVMTSSGVPVTKKERVVHESICYRYTKSGYKPLHSYTASNGHFFETNEIVKLWTSVVLERMKARVTNCQFLEREYGFDYKFPQDHFEDWF